MPKLSIGVQGAVTIAIATVLAAAVLFFVDWVITHANESETRRQRRLRELESTPPGYVCDSHVLMPAKVGRVTDIVGDGRFFCAIYEDGTTKCWQPRYCK